MKDLRNTRKFHLQLALLALVAIAAMACGGSETAASPSAPALLAAEGGTLTDPSTGGNGTNPGNGGNGNGPGDGTCGEGDGSCTGSSGAITDEVLDAMNLSIQDEYHAEFVYARVIADFGEVQPFTNIINAEQRHSAVVGRLFTNHGLPVPASEWNLGNVPSFATLPAACAAAVEAEIANIALYDEFLNMDLPQDVRNVFTNIRAASLEKHLPAFEACCLCDQ